MTTFWCEWAWLGDREPRRSVRLALDEGRFDSVDEGPADPRDVVLPGLTLPGFANAHSHAFHRALRGRTHRDEGTFWTWRRQMYEIAARLDPDEYHTLATRTFREMVAAGYTVVGEFHYVHHGPEGRPYDDPNAMSRAVIAAAEDAGIRMTLLDTLYLHGGIDDRGGYLDPDPVQVRFSDRTGAAWRDRVESLDHRGAGFLLGAAIHSVRAVDPASMEHVRRWAAEHDAPVHAHVSEQPAENDQVRRAHRRTPVRLLAERGVTGRRFTAVHATHLTEDDIEVLGSSSVCLCPTTERDLADGVAPSRALADAGAGLCVGSDSQAFIDPLAELRGVEMHQRLTKLRRGVHPPSELAAIGTVNGYHALGWSRGGRIEPGYLADFVTVAVEDGTPPGDLLGSVMLAGRSTDVTTTVVAGSVVHRRPPARHLDAEA